MYILVMLGAGLIAMITGTILDAHEVSCGLNVAWIGFLLFVVGTYLFWRVCEQTKRAAVCRTGKTFILVGLIGTFFHIYPMILLILLGACVWIYGFLFMPMIAGVKEAFKL